MSNQNHHSKSSTKSSKFHIAVLVIIIGVLLGLAAYILLLLLSPKIIPNTNSTTTSPQHQEQKGNRLIIQTVSINAEILEGNENVLDKGVWHRLPAQGNPEIGGNMILTGHSFVWGFTPRQVKERSIFYNLQNIKVGDEIKVKWNEKEYNYKVSETKEVKPNQTEIEKNTKEPQLTIYTCTLSGAADGRVVVIAKPAD